MAKEGVMARIRWRRVRIFILGVSVSVAIVVAFFWLAWLLNDSAEYAWIARVLYGLLVVLNPLLPLVQRAVVRAFPASPGAARVATQIAFVTVFVGWWWLVAVVADRFVS
ncbi:MAG TPA: hypothetical protein VGH97_14420, partial [Thermoanaerobaculia bacterium]